MQASTHQQPFVNDTIINNISNKHNNHIAAAKVDY
jgi:hypothetical protein